MNIIPALDYSVTIDQHINNGRPAKSADIAMVDDYQSWLAMCAHPQLPTILTGTNSSSHGGGVPIGLKYTNTGAWGDWHYIDLLIPPYINHMAWGATVVGHGFVRGHVVANSRQYMLTINTTGGGGGLTADDMQTAWADLAHVAYTSDKQSAAYLLAVGGGVTGSRVPRRLQFKYQLKAKAGTHGITVVALHFRYISPPPGTSTTGYTHTSAGGTDL